MILCHNILCHNIIITRLFQELETARRNLTEKQAHVLLVAQDVAVLRVSQLLNSTTTLQRKESVMLNVIAVYDH